MGVIAVFIGGFNHYATVGKYIECVESDANAVDNVTIPQNDVQKILRDGQMFIIRDGKRYNAMGQEL